MTNHQLIDYYVIMKILFFSKNKIISNENISLLDLNQYVIIFD